MSQTLHKSHLIYHLIQLSQQSYRYYRILPDSTDVKNLSTKRFKNSSKIIQLIESNTLARAHTPSITAVLTSVIPVAVGGELGL